MAAPDLELVLDKVSAGYGETSVLEGVSLSLKTGERLGLIGRNGAGKTTTLATIVGLADRIGGAIRLNGADMSRMAPFKRARAGIGYVPQTRDIFPSLTVEENLIAAMGGRRNDGLIAAAYDMFPRLKERRSNGGNQLSGGEQQMLSVARALATQPKLLLLDEPLEGLAPQIAEELMDVINRLAAETGVGCILVEQHVDVVMDFADRILILERGRPAFYGPTEALRSQPDILDRTVGLSKTGLATESTTHVQA
jgi:branched-chain amino acid transport system ATP-binding protein